MPSYIPSYPDDWQPPNKRARRDDRPPKRKGEVKAYNSYRPQYSQTPSDNGTATSKTSTHTRRDRKNNRSSRIHSLRNLLGRGGLPPNIQQEKERELASLLFDQEKDRVAKGGKKTLEKYHKVRFFERKKAERNLKRLQKERDSLQKNTAPVTDGDGDVDPDTEDERVQARQARQARLRELETEIHCADVDLQYTLYSPLKEKYISLFVEDPLHFSKKKKQNIPPGVKKGVYAMFDAEQQKQLGHVHDEGSQIIRSAAGLKPPMWYEVERCMKDTASTDTKKLELLRDSQSTVPTAFVDRELVTSRNKESNDVNRGAGQKRKRPAFLDEDEDELMNPANADTDSEDSQDGGMILDDEDGFFER